MGIVSTTPDVPTWLERLDGRTAPIVAALRQLVDDDVAEVHELVYHGALGYGTSGSGFDRILYVAPQPTRVNLGFFFGGSLDDPEHLLQGTGKRMRHIKITSVEATRTRALRALVGQALADGPAQVAKLHDRARRR